MGMYVHGSLASGDFDPLRSDVEFVVVTRAELADEIVSALAAMHASIALSDLKWRTNYEGSYIPAQAIRRYDPANAVHPAVGVDGSFGLEKHGSDWVIQRHIIREQGIIMVGPAPGTLIDPVSADDMRLAVRQALAEWWAPQLADPRRLQSSEYQAYAVLTMCRAMYTLEHGTSASKPQAGRWARSILADRWTRLIDAALAWRHGVTMDALGEVLAFIRYTVERSQGCLADPPR